MPRLTRTRIYVVAARNDGVERLVRALSKSRAIRDSVSVHVASQEDLQRLLARGVVVENDVSPASPPATHRRRAP